MKRILLSAATMLTVYTVSAQAEFNKSVAEAKASYNAGKLDEARFAMQQALQELDIITGKELLKILPAKMGEKTANTKADNVSGSTGFFGVVIHREYGSDSALIELEIIGNSPFLASINSMLALPFMGGDQKVIKINGYKALVSKSGDAGNEEYEIQLPINNSLITFKAPGYSQDQVIKMANTLPVQEMAKMLQ